MRPGRSLTLISVGKGGHGAEGIADEAEVDEDEEDGDDLGDEEGDEHVDGGLELGGEDDDEEDAAEHVGEGEDGDGTVGAAAGGVVGPPDLPCEGVAGGLADEEVEADEEADAEDAAEGDDDGLVGESQVLQLLVDGVLGGGQDAGARGGVGGGGGANDAHGDHGGDEEGPDDDVGDEQEDGLEAALVLGDALLGADGQVGTQQKGHGGEVEEGGQLEDGKVAGHVGGDGLGLDGEGVDDAEDAEQAQEQDGGRGQGDLLL